MTTRVIKFIFNTILKLGYWPRNPRNVNYFLNRALCDSGLPWTNLSPMPLKDIFQGINDSDETIMVQNPFTRKRGISVELDELIAILSILRHIKARKIVEVGTFDGNTALNLALNVGDKGSVVTIDLPSEGLDSVNRSGVSRPTSFTNRQYVGHETENKVRQVYADSAQLDWNTLQGPFDLAFIDGDHTASYVRSDTRNTLSVLKPGGVIIWHDYDFKPVANVLDRAVEHGDPICWIQGTRLATARFEDPSASIENFRD